MSELRRRLEDALHEANVQAFLRVIREGETSQGEDAYRTIVGGGSFESLHDHPRRRMFIERLNLHSTAAGAYQFLSSTWDECRKALNLSDFSPGSQDLAAVYLIRRRGALDDVLAGRLIDAINKCAQEWASLPGDAYGQGGISLERAIRVFAAWGGVIAQQAPRIGGTTAPDVSATYEGAESATITKEPPMAPLIPAIVGPLVGELAGAIPRIASLWKGKSEVAERNVALGSAILETVSKAVGAANAQEAVERVRADPAAAQVAREAIDREWGKLDELREASIGAAREFALRSPERIIVANMVFHEVLGLLMVLISAGGGLAALFWSDISSELKGAIVTLMLIGGWTGVREFFFGGSRGSDIKTALMAQRDPRSM